MNSAEYQDARKHLLDHIDRLRTIRDDLVSRDPLFVNVLPTDVKQKMLMLDRESTRLRNPDLTIAFVGGFSAGKSSLVNAFLGRYLLPESTKVTTAVPTFIRSAANDECAEIHYLNEAEVENLGELYRKELSLVFKIPELATAPFAALMEQVKPLADQGRGRRLFEQFQIYHEQRHRRDPRLHGRVVTVSLPEAQDKIRDETEAMFLDRVVLSVRHTDIPTDVVLLDLPGVSVPNPRHREITFRYVREEAHAIVFVLMATRLFDKDEREIMELFRTGESRISDKTFWVLNRWDALSLQQKRQTVADFEATMREFAIPNGFQSFHTNALHGLLSQLGIRGAVPTDLALQSHVRDYDDALPVTYGSSHETAFRESQIPKLQKEVLAFLNNRLRLTTLHSAHENAKAVFCEPLTHHLRRAKDTDDTFVNTDLSRKERETLSERVKERFEQRIVEIKRQLQDLRNNVAVKRSAILQEHTKDLVKTLEEKIVSGPETDAYHIYQEIIAGRELRKYPYHFEIEMQIVDNLNTMLKKNFRRIVGEQVHAVFEELTGKLDDVFEKVRGDVGYNTQVMAPLEDVIHKEKTSFINRVDGVVMTLAAQLDELLLYKPKNFGFFGGNEILVGLEQAARMGFQNLINPGQAIMESDFSDKTKQIRQTLKQHYIDKVRQYHERITHDIFPIVINNMQHIEVCIVEFMKSKYRPALEIMLEQEVGGEFAVKRKDVEERSRRFRDIIDQIEQTQRNMEGVLSVAVK